MRGDDYVACVRSGLARDGAGGARGVSREQGSRAKVLSLQTWQSSRKSQNPPTISRSTSHRQRRGKCARARRPASTTRKRASERASRAIVVYPSV